MARCFKFQVSASFSSGSFTSSSLALLPTRNIDARSLRPRRILESRSLTYSRRRLHAALAFDLRVLGVDDHADCPACRADEDRRRSPGHRVEECPPRSAGADGPGCRLSRRRLSGCEADPWRGSGRDLACGSSGDLGGVSCGWTLVPCPLGGLQVFSVGEMQEMQQTLPRIHASGQQFRHFSHLPPRKLSLLVSSSLPIAAKHKTLQLAALLRELGEADSRGGRGGEL